MDRSNAAGATGATRVTGVTGATGATGANGANGTTDATGANARALVPTETYDFSFHFEMGSLMVSPVHIRIEQLRPFIAAHTHSNVSYEIHYAYRGRGTVTVGDNTFDVRPGVLYVTGPGIVHMQVSSPDDPVIEYCLYLNCRRTSRRADDPLLLFTDTTFWIGMDDGSILELLTRLIEDNRHGQSDTLLMSETLLRLIVLQLTRIYRRDMTTHAKKPPLLTRDSFMPILEDAFFYRYSTLTLNELAGLLNLSVRQTQRLLLTHFGKSFSQKLTDARMAAAFQFLESTRLSITEIAERLGFSSIEHFSAAFRRYTGRSPRAYRREILARGGPAGGEDAH